MAIPTIMLYEGSIWVIAMMEKKRAAKDAQDGGGTSDSST
jgi:Sec-independent protein secretion pathway component TatC